VLSKDGGGILHQISLKLICIPEFFWFTDGEISWVSGLTVFSPNYLRTEKAQEHKIWHKGGV